MNWFRELWKKAESGQQVEKETQSEQGANSETGEKGAAVILIASGSLAALLIAGTAAVGGAEQDLYRAEDFSQRTNALMLAEAALEDAAIHLDQIQNWATIPLPHDEFVGYQPLGHGHYQARLLNNLDDTSSTDSDNAVRILAKGYSANNEETVTLEGMYRRIAFDLDPLAVLTVCGNDIYTGQTGSTIVSGYDYYLPPSPCSGSGCNPVRKAGAILKGGVFYETAGRTTPLNGSSVLLGNPGEASGVAALQGDKGFCAKARLISEFMYRLPTPEKISTWPASSSSTYGTSTSPKLVYVAKGTTLTLSGTTQGFGVLLIDGTVKQTGTFTFSGLVVVGRNAKIQFKGTANLFGAVVTAGGFPNSPATADTIYGNVRMVYCKDALSALHGIVNPGLWYSWREYKGSEEPYPTVAL